jgi:putative FmdB family regulatory protein
MPIYEYECQSCGERFDKLFTSISKRPPQIICPACESEEVQRLISAPAIHTGAKGSSRTDTTTTPSKPPVFGRKELKEAQEKKRQLRERALYDD